jgi:type VI protein secretion system component VasF
MHCMQQGKYWGAGNHQKPARDVRQRLYQNLERNADKKPRALEHYGQPKIRRIVLNIESS